ncbi:F510_1955 family glycosylhydrolase [Neobacillus sp. FSL H8-0543]|uniref:F510_1955 family glycosylhydrolase n=1 Tax=Neobacillus sp. FSL H8-0543 TaxID=2954672 RepID=UPI00315833D7
MKIQRKMLLFVLIGLLIVASGCTNESQSEKSMQSKTEEEVKFEIIQAEDINIKQIHGIGYPGNDQALYIATNTGIKMYKESKWLEMTTNQHNYSSFQAVKDGFITSGSLNKGEEPTDSLGIVQSNDKGQSLSKIAFHGENHFYFMAASYFGNGIYVINQEENDQLDLGVNFSTDNGKNWTTSELKDFTADSLGMIAVNPANEDIIAMSTMSGIFYSEDNGNTMKLITDPYMVTALTFVGDNLLFSSVENEKIHLKMINPKSGEQTTLSIPFLDYQNPITFLAVNPHNDQQLAFTTYTNDLFESTDNGTKWINLLQDGKTEPE